MSANPEDEQIEVVLTLEAFSITEQGKKVHSLKRTLVTTRNEWKILRKGTTMAFRALSEEVNTNVPPRAYHD